MTALAGIWRGEGGEDPARACERMLRAQQVFAPDAPASWAEGDVAMGRRLFRLLPEDRFDRAPVVSPDSGCVLVADLRLDNRDDLQAELGIAAPDAAGMPDVLLLMKALDRWGEDAVRRLVGDFAFAWWDAAKRQLLLARDFLGQRPLHYHRGDGFFAFASMPKGLHALPQIAPAPDVDAMAQFVALLPETGSNSFFRGIEKVLPGHIVKVTREGLSSTRYWNPEPRDLGLKRPGDYEAALRDQMDRAVASRLRGCDGRVASHLSAGLDSSAVAATAAMLLAPTGGTVTAYTAVPREGFAGGRMREAIVDEGPLAAAVAGLHPNIEHVKIRTEGKSPLDDLDRHYFLYERPTLNLCNGLWATAILDDAKRRGHRVLLNGQAGNMSFSYLGMHLLSELLRQGRLVALAGLVQALLRNGARGGTVAAQTFGPFVPSPVWRAIGRIRGKKNRLGEYTAIDPARRSALEQVARERGLDFDYRPRADGFETRVGALRRTDLGNYNKGMLGGWGIDVRDPTADQRLVEFCLSVPPQEFLRGGVPRSLARRAFLDRLPKALLDERRKGYQAADWHENLTAARDQLRSEIDRLGALPEAAGTLNVARMAQLVEDWPDGSWEDPAIVAQYRLALLRGTSAGHFLRKASGSNL